MYSSYVPSIMSLIQVDLQIFCWQGCFTIQNAKVGKENNSAKYLQNFVKK